MPAQSCRAWLRTLVVSSMSALMAYCQMWLASKRCRLCLQMLCRNQLARTSITFAMIQHMGTVLCGTCRIYCELVRLGAGVLLVPSDKVMTTNITARCIALPSWGACRSRGLQIQLSVYSLGRRYDPQHYPPWPVSLDRDITVACLQRCVRWPIWTYACSEPNTFLNISSLY